MLSRILIYGLLAVIIAATAMSAFHRHNLSSLPHPDRVLPVGDTTQARLAAHVQTLAGTIGERNLFEPAAWAKAADYVEGEFKKAGFEPKSQAYSVYYERKEPYPTRNIEVVIPADRTDAPVFVVGGHYDSAPGTPGADDNASGTAAVLELARRFKGKPGKVELRFVAFSTEEPPFFGTEQMGSAHYAMELAKEKREVAGMLSLEMLGYYSDEPHSQSYPLFLSLFYPSRANYMGAVANLRSRKLLKAFKKGWNPPKNLPLVAAALPELIPEITYSDQLWFWNHKWPGLMITDTAFSRNPHYHQVTDKPPQLDYDRFADAVDGLEAAIAALTR